MLKVENDLTSEAKMVLDFNWTGEYTKPDPASTRTSGRGTRR